MTLFNVKRWLGQFVDIRRNFSVFGMAALVLYAREAAAQNPAPSDDPNKIPLTDITSDSSLIDWRLSAGLSKVDLSSKDGDSWGSSLRAVVGPHVTDSFTPGFEVGGRFYESANYLDISLVPAITFKRISRFAFEATPVLGVSLANIKRGVLGEPENGHYGKRFQLQGGGEVAVWYSVGESKEPSVTDRGIARMGELASDYRSQCLSADKKTTEVCSALADLINNYRQIIRMKATTECDVPIEVLKKESDKSTITAEILNKIDVCSFQANERRSNATAKPRAGVAFRLAHTGGRDLPSATTYEFRVGISF
jgi:hypothetical protein